MKSKSSAKKRFSFTGSGKAKRNQANKRHNMRKRSQKVIRNARGTVLVADADAARIKQYLPYGG